jgi:hypothetical protein
MKAKIDKKQYIKLYASLQNSSVFNSPQWLDGVSEQWDAVVVLKDTGDVIAGFPYCIKKHLFFDAISMPLLTPHLSVIIDENYTEYKDKLTSLLIDQLPNTSYQSLILDPSTKNFIPWKWKNYSVTTRYTFHLSALGLYQDNVKGHLRSADKKLNIHEYTNIEEHFHITCETYKGQNLKPPYSLEHLKKIYTQNKNRIKLIKCIDENNKTHASILCVYDDQFCYNISSGRSQDAFRGAVTYITDYAIKWSIANHKIFDFEGSSIQSIYKYYEPFGGELVTHYRVTKSSNKLIHFLAAMTNRI